MCRRLRHPYREIRKARDRQVGGEGGVKLIRLGVGDGDRSVLAQSATRNGDGYRNGPLSVTAGGDIILQAKNFRYRFRLTLVV